MLEGSFSPCHLTLVGQGLPPIDAASSKPRCPLASRAGPGERRRPPGLYPWNFTSQVKCTSSQARPSWIVGVCMSVQRTLAAGWFDGGRRGSRSFIFMLIKIKYLGTKFCKSSISTSVISCNFPALIHFIIVISKNGSLKPGGNTILYGFLLSC